MAERKFRAGDRVVGNDRKGSFWGRSGKVLDYIKPSQYWVRFDDGKVEAVDSSWLDREEGEGQGP